MSTTQLNETDWLTVMLISDVGFTGLHNYAHTGFKNNNNKPLHSDSDVELRSRGVLLSAVFVASPGKTAQSDRNTDALRSNLQTCGVQIDTIIFCRRTAATNMHADRCSVDEKYVRM